MRKFGIILSILTICVIIVFISIDVHKNNKIDSAAVEKAKEEFALDYNEEIIIIDLKARGKMRIITIYGEYDLVTYIYNDGEIWNYDNKSN